MMATDYYGTPSYGYDTFVTISGKRNVALQVLDSTKWMPAVRPKFAANYVDRVVPPRDPRGDNSMALSNDAQIAIEQGMMIAEVNIAIGAIDRILKTTKHGKSNNRELTNARAELDHWRGRLLKTVHKC
jgi:hypothetical protein